MLSKLNKIDKKKKEECIDSVNDIFANGEGVLLAVSKGMVTFVNHNSPNRHVAGLMGAVCEGYPEIKEMMTFYIQEYGKSKKKKKT